ncbi:tetratricopeptide repeat protein [Plantactinospora sp. B5E13]|uniref:tetratricopeptide repeat protein n=1 Tax=Plantactinospora sp. B5E13 TaxID=3153758 RepID=UPI00325E4684
MPDIEPADAPAGPPDPTDRRIRPAGDGPSGPAHQWIRARHRHDRRRLLTAVAAGAVLVGMDAHRSRLPGAVPAGAVLAEVDAHRRRRGPYTAAGQLLRTVVPEAWRRYPELVSRHEVEVLSLAPELRDLIPATRHTLTSLAVPEERTRFYSRLRTLRIAHGLVEFLNDHLRRLGGGPRYLLVDNLHHADPTDQELCAVLLRRADPELLRLVIATDTDDLVAPPGPLAVSLPGALRRYATEVVAAATPPPEPEGSDLDLARRYVTDDCVDDDPRVRAAYQRLDPADRARLHDERVAELTGHPEWSVRLGALPYHAEHGTDPAGAGADALRAALDYCVDMGFYHATVDYGERGRAVVDWTGQLDHWWAFTTKMTTSLAALGLPEQALALYHEARAQTTAPMVHLQAAYATAMLHTRYLPKEHQDHHTARGWANLAIAIAQCLPDPKIRAFKTVFNQNGLALVAVHEGRLDEALTLVSNGIDRLEQDLDDTEHALHRSVLRHNRSQVYAALGRYDDALTDLDAVIAADPHYPEYHFDRGNLLRRLGRPAEAVDCYERALALSPPFPEVYYNRGDARVELGDLAGALADFGYVLELDPTHLDAYVNRAGLRLELGDADGAWHDVRAGLALDPENPHLRCVQGQLLTADDPTAATRVLTGLVTTHPDFADGWAARGAAAYDRGELADAVTDFGRALALADNPAVRFNRGTALAGAGRYEEALVDFTEVHAATGDPEARTQIGICLERLGRATVRMG